MKPIYADKIVVAIKYSNCIRWYILDKDLCFLDYIKLLKLPTLKMGFAP